jgi:hypothetical protein
MSGRRKRFLTPFSAPCRRKTENGRQFAERLLDDKYGKGNYPIGPGSEFSKIKKWGDRAFE